MEWVSEWLLFNTNEQFSSDNKKLFERQDDDVVILVLDQHAERG